MRIISGRFKGRRFSPPTNITARPTTDFAKEGLFSVLATNYVDFDGLVVLDLFAGTGSVGLEFVSRGAKSVTSVEMSERQLTFIHKIVKELRVDNMRVCRSDVFRFLKSATSHYDVVFADPPYQLKELPLLPDLVFEHQLLNADGIFVLEHGKENDFSAHEHFVEHRNYGNVNFSIFR